MPLSASYRGGITGGGSESEQSLVNHLAALGLTYKTVYGKTCEI